MTRWSAIDRTPPQLLRARLRLALHSRGGENLNRLVHHERGRYCRKLDHLSGWELLRGREGGEARSAGPVFRPRARVSDGVWLEIDALYGFLRPCEVVARVIG
jgi:hypothetical protein